MAKKPKISTKVIIEAINVLFEEAKVKFKTDPKQADNLVNKARNIAMKNRVSIPSKLQKSFCKHCYAYLNPPTNCRIRTKDGVLIYHCLNCKKYMRFPYK